MRHGLLGLVGSIILMFVFTDAYATRIVYETTNFLESQGEANLITYRFRQDEPLMDVATEPYWEYLCNPECGQPVEVSLDNLLFFESTFRYFDADDVLQEVLFTLDEVTAFSTWEVLNCYGCETDFLVDTIEAVDGLTGISLLIDYEGAGETGACIESVEFDLFECDYHRGVDARTANVEVLVPEPSSFVLLSLGLLGIGCARRQLI